MVTQKEEKEKQKTSRETLGKFFYDLAKTTFAVMVLGNVATVFIGDTDAVIVSTMIFLGMFITFLFAYVGNKVLKNYEYGSIDIDFCMAHCCYAAVCNMAQHQIGQEVAQQPVTIVRRTEVCRSVCMLRK